MLDYSHVETKLKDTRFFFKNSAFSFYDESS